jgi:hypothetical protein
MREVDHSASNIFLTTGFAHKLDFDRKIYILKDSLKRYVNRRIEK